MNIHLIKLLLTLKNASCGQKELVILKYHSSYVELLHLLYREGFIQSFKVQVVPIAGTSILHNKICIILRRNFYQSILKYLKIVSSPSQLKYLTLRDIYKVSDKKAALFFSSNKGLLTSIDCKKQKVGGKLLFIC